jgi:hypothetical protein
MQFVGLLLFHNDLMNEKASNNNLITVLFTKTDFPEAVPLFTD